MVKRFSIPMLSLLVALCGLTAWGAREVIHRVTPDPAPTVTTTVPAADEEVQNLPNGILITFSTDVFKPMEAADITLVNENEVTVATWREWMGEYVVGFDGQHSQANQIWLCNPANLPASDNPLAANLAPGTYTLKIPANTVYSSEENAEALSDGNAAFSYSFSIVAPAADPTKLQLVSADPASPSTVQELEKVTLTFEEGTTISAVHNALTTVIGNVYDVANPDTPVQKIYSVTYTGLQNNQCAFILNPVIKKGGTYKIVFPEGEFKSTTNKFSAQIELTYIVDAPVTFALTSSDPSDGETVTSVKEFILDFDLQSGQSVTVNSDFKGVYGAIVNEDTNESVEILSANSFDFTNLAGQPVGENQYVCKLASELATAGNYRLTIAEGALCLMENGKEINEEIEINFTVNPLSTTAIVLDKANCLPAENQVFAKATDLGELKLVFNQPVSIVGGNTHSFACILSAEGNVTIDSWSNTVVTADPANPNVVILNNLWNDTKYSKMVDGVYKMILFADAVEANGVKNERQEYNFEIKSSQSGASTFDLGVYYTYWDLGQGTGDDTWKTSSFDTTISLQNLPTGCSVDMSVLTNDKITFTRESDGAEVEVEVFDNSHSNPSGVIFLCDDATWPSPIYGTWSYTIPEGFVVSGESVNAEKTYKITLEDPDGLGPKPDFEVTKADFLNWDNSFVDSEGTPIPGKTPQIMYKRWPTIDGGENLLDWETNPKSIANLEGGKSIVFNTTQDAWITCLSAQVYPKDNPEVKMCNYIQNCVEDMNGGQYPSNYIGTSSPYEEYPHPILTVGGNEGAGEFEIGKEYVLEVWFYTSKVVQGNDWQHQNADGHWMMEFSGATTPYDFADAQLLSVVPAPMSLGGEDPVVEGDGITDYNAPIVFTFSEPVNMTAQVNLGNSATGPVSKCTPNADRTVWSVVPGRSAVSSADAETIYTPSFLLIIKATDDNGKVLQGTTGLKATSCWAPEFRFLGVGFDIDVTPAGGTVESLSQFEVTSPQELLVGDIENLPYLTTKSGATVATANILPDGTSATIVLSETVTSPGEYQLVVPAACFKAAQEMVNNKVVLDFTIEGAANDAVPTIASDATIHELGIVGFTVNNLVTVNSRARLTLFKGDTETENRVTNVPVQTSVNEGKTLIFGDFSVDGQPMVLEGGAEYFFVIPAGLVTVADSDIEYDEMKGSFTAATSGAAEFVILTTETNGLTVTSSPVAKGETVEVKLTPAENWRVDVVSFNGEDVSDDVNNGVYVTEPLQADATIVVAFEYTGTTITGTNDINEELGSLKLNVWSENTNINVKGLSQGMNVSLYTLNGLEMATGTATGSIVTFNDVAPGTYLIVVSNGSVTEAVKLQHK